MMHQKYSHDRLMAKPGTSFLSRQRKALYKNPVPLNTTIANTLASTASPGYGTIGGGTIGDGTIGGGTIGGRPNDFQFHHTLTNSV